MGETTLSVFLIPLTTHGWSQAKSCDPFYVTITFPTCSFNVSACVMYTGSGVSSQLSELCVCGGGGGHCINNLHMFVVVCNLIVYN